MNQTIVESSFAAAARAIEELPPPVRSEIAFAGRSNVGKSSLLNALMKRRNLARTSSTPGCTRAITFFDVRVRDGTTLSLVDLPGYGYAARSKVEKGNWATIIEAYLLRRPALVAVAILVDARRGLEADDLDLLKMLAEPSPSRQPLRTVVVATKLDKVPRGMRSAAVNKLVAPGRTAVGFSTELPETADEVWNRLYR